MYSCNPIRAKMASMNTVRMITSCRFFTEYTIAPTIVLRPGTTATDLRALNTLNVFSAESWPRSIAIVT